MLTSIMHIHDIDICIFSISGKVIHTLDMGCMLHVVDHTDICSSACLDMHSNVRTHICAHVHTHLDER
jgi:hypothetical protein